MEVLGGPSGSSGRSHCSFIKKDDERYRLWCCLTKRSEVESTSDDAGGVTWGAPIGLHREGRRNVPRPARRLCLGGLLRFIGCRGPGHPARVVRRALAGH